MKLSAGLVVTVLLVFSGNANAGLWKEITSFFKQHEMTKQKQELDRLNCERLMQAHISSIEEFIPDIRQRVHDPFAKDALADYEAKRKYDRENPIGKAISQAKTESGQEQNKKTDPSYPIVVRCFPGEMRVQTPNGLRRIDELQLGDELLSWDVSSQAVVANRVADIIKTDNRSYGTLQDLNPPIHVTEEHPFYVGGNQYQDVGSISPDTNVYRLNQAMTSLEPVPRGEYFPSCGVGTVYDLSMEGEPRNFFVEGILVHNKPSVWF